MAATDTDVAYVKVIRSTMSTAYPTLPQRAWGSAALCLALALGLLAAPRLADAVLVTVESTDDASDAAPGNGVCSTGTGICTLRAAIEELNALPAGLDPDVVHFDVPGAEPHTIAPSSPLPAFTGPAIVDGYSQPGASPNTLGEGTDAILLIVLDGAASTPGDGLVFLGGTSAVRGLVISGWLRSEPGVGGHAIRVAELGGNVVEGNFLGTDATGLVAVGNEESGVFVDGVDGNVVGGPSPAACNLIAGNAVIGIDITGADNRIEGNLVGLDATGQLELPNERGIRIYGPRTIVGGTAPGAGNVVSGNGQYGINVLAFGTESRILGNFVGTDVTGTIDLGNGGDGIRVSSGAEDVSVGGSEEGAGNLVSGNNRHGIQLTGSDHAIVQGNLIGTDVGGTQDVGNGGAGVLVDADHVLVGGAANVIAFNEGDGIRVFSTANQNNAFLGNSIHSNVQLGIDLENDGVTLNDPLDTDIGANALQNFPVLTSAVSDALATTVEGNFESTPDTVFLLEFFASPGCDPSGFGEGQRYLGAASVTTDEAGLAAIDAVVQSPVVGGSAVTALATASGGPTSEFSACISAEGPPVITTTTTSTSTSITTTSTTTDGSGSTTTTDGSGSTTITSTTIDGSSTTTTTLAVFCTQDADCNDGTACTTDTCIEELCSRTQVERLDSVLCHVTNARALLPGVASKKPCRPVAAKRLNKIERRYVRAKLTTSARRCRRFARRGRRPTRKLPRKLARQHRKGCLEPPAGAIRLLDETTALNLAAETLVLKDACTP